MVLVGATTNMFGFTLVAFALLVGSMAAPVSAWAGPILNEICYDGSGADADDVFTEIYGDPGLSLSGWSLQGINGADGKAYRKLSLTGATIPSDGVLVIATSSALGAVLSARDFTANVDWQNGPDAVRLLDATGSVVDALQYGNAGSYGAGEGTYAVDVLAGYSLSRDLFGTDTNDNATDFSSLQTPTPGTGPVAPVPEPSTLALLSTGALGLAAARKRRRQKARGVPAQRSGEATSRHARSSSRTRA